jgi:hypothetical protein
LHGFGILAFAVLQGKENTTTGHQEINNLKWQALRHFAPARQNAANSEKLKVDEEVMKNGSGRQRR